MEAQVFQDTLKRYARHGDKNLHHLMDYAKKFRVEKLVLQYMGMRRYMMERFLERISLSAYSENFILKGGILITAMVGFDVRVTMDLDATVKDAAVIAEET